MSTFSTFKPGLLVVARQDFVDSYEDGDERITRAGEKGWIHAQSHVAKDGLPAWTVYFPNGAALTFEDRDLRDGAQVEVRAMKHEDLLLHTHDAIAIAMGALGNAVLQIEQMRGLFDDADGEIGSAVEDARLASSRLHFSVGLLKERFGAGLDSGSATEATAAPPDAGQELASATYWMAQCDQLRIQLDANQQDHALLRKAAEGLYRALDDASGVVDASEGEAFAFQAELQEGARALGINRGDRDEHSSRDRQVGRM